MPSQSPLKQLRSVFGSFSQDLPEPTQVDVDAAHDEARDASVIIQSTLPDKPKIAKTGLLEVPSMRIDGSSEDPPWNVPEPILWDLIRQAPIEFVEERVMDGLNGVFWARYRNHEGQLRSGLLRFDPLNKAYYENWRAEFGLRSKDILRRNLAAYEAAKAFGMEDMVAPVASREVNLVPLISDAARETVAAELKISPNGVDETFGTAALLHVLPMSARNFVEHWSTLGHDAKNRWERASNRLRHSIYRAIAFDFILGTGDRSLCSFLYNETSDKLALYDFGLTFPDLVFSAEKYLQMRTAGWGRKPAGAMEDPTDAMPPHSIDTLHLGRLIQGGSEQECVDTFAQLGGITEQVVLLLGNILVEQGVSNEGIAGMLARLAFLREDPVIAFKNPTEFVRNVLVPLRKGYGFGEGRNRAVVDYVSSTMTLIINKEFYFPKAIQDDAKQSVSMSV